MRTTPPGKATHLLACALAAALTAGCGADSLERLKEQQAIKLALSSGSATFRALEPEQTTAKTKLLFIIDKSGSNGQTDPGGRRRFTSLINFVDQQAAANPADLSLAYVSFSTGIITTRPFTNDFAAYRQLLTQERARADAGNTSFLAALNAGINIIRQDIQAALADPARPSSTYVVFHISDGQPTDDPAPYNGIKATVESLSALQDGGNGAVVSGVYLHTGFYYVNNDIPVARELMRKMAEEWSRTKGQALVFTGNNLIDFSKFKIPGNRIPTQLVDVFMTNINVAWDLSGGTARLERDSDGDGLSDAREARYGSDIISRDSDDNGISDYVEWRKYNKPCEDGACSPQSARDFGEACSAYLDPERPPGTQVYLDRDGDGLNDCEEAVVLGSDPSRFATLNWIPHWLGYRFLLGILPSQRDDFLDPDNDGNNNYSEIRRGTPINVANGSIVNLQTYDYDLVQTSVDSAGVPTYALRIRNIPTLGDPQLNRIRLYVMERSDSSKDIRYMRMAERPLNLDGTLSMSAADFGPTFKFTCDGGNCL